MIRLVVNGEDLDLSPETSITLVESSTIFDDETLKGTYSFPFNIPATKKNRRLLGSPENLLNTKDIQKRHRCQKYLSGSQKLDGFLVLRTLSDLTYNVNLQSKGGMLVDLKDKQLSEIKHDVIEVGGVNTQKWNYTLADFSKGIVNNASAWKIEFRFEFWETSEVPSGDKGITIISYTEVNGIAAGDGRISAFYEVLANKINARPRSGFPSDGFPCTAVAYDTYIEFTSIDQNLTVLITSFYYYPTTPQNPTESTNVPGHFQAGGIPWTLVQSSVESTGELIDFMTATQEGLNDETRVRFPMIRNDAFYGASNPDFCRVFNYYNLGNYYKNSQDNPRRHSVMPVVSIIYILRKIFENIGYTVEGSFLTMPEPLREYLYPNYALDKISAVDTGNGAVAINIFESTIDLARCMPSVTVAEFLKAIKKKYALSIDFIDYKNTVRIEPFAEITNDIDYVDFTFKATPRPQITPGEYDGISFAYDFGNDELKEERIKDIEDKNLKDYAATFDLLPNFGNIPDDLRYVRNLGAYYLYGIDPRGALRWHYYCEGFIPYKEGNGSRPITIEIAPMFMFRSARDYGRRFKADGTFKDTIEMPAHGVKITDKIIFISDTTGNDGTSLQYVVEFTPFNITIDTFQLSANGGVSAYVFDKEATDVELAIIMSERTTMLIPEIQVKGSSPEFNLGNNKCSLRTMYDYGIPPEEHFYPFASPYEYSKFGAQIGSSNMTFDQFRGIVEKWWRAKINFYEKLAPLVQYLIRLSHLDHQKIEFAKKVRIKNVTLLINSIKTTFTMRGIKDSVMDLFKF